MRTFKAGNMALIFGTHFPVRNADRDGAVAPDRAHRDREPHVVMMMSVGFALGIMVPAIGINYLYQRKSGMLFAIDAGHFTVGMAAMGGVFLLFL